MLKPRDAFQVQRRSMWRCSADRKSSTGHAGRQSFQNFKAPRLGRIFFKCFQQPWIFAINGSMWSFFYIFGGPDIAAAIRTYETIDGRRCTKYSAANNIFYPDGAAEIHGRANMVGQFFCLLFSVGDSVPVGQSKSCPGPGMRERPKYPIC